MFYIFEDYELDTRLQVLCRHGVRIRLRPKSFRVLAYLLEHRDRVVSQQELVMQVWPGQGIRRTTAAACVRQVRQALDDTGRRQRLIKTVAGQGYRFIGRVTVRAALNEAAMVPLSSLCLRCGSHYVPPANFCATCGAPLAGALATPDPSALDASREVLPGQVEPPHPSANQRDRLEAERRQLTVLFCDVVDSTLLSEQLELEDFHDVLRAYQDMCADVVRQFDGYIAQYLGDGLLAYFGYPSAQEDDAQRAVSAGLGIMSALAALNSSLERERGVCLALRVGLHTGLVIVGDTGGAGRHDTLAFGDTVNIAARIQNMAKPNTVVISAATARLVQGYFDCEDLGIRHFRGVTTPMRLSRVLRASGARSRLEAARRVGFTPLVGRDAEVLLLRQYWHQVAAGRGRVVLLRGEAGIGKSRLVQVMQDHMVPATTLALVGRCSPYHQHSALYPVIELLQKLLFHPDDGAATKRQKLEAMITQSALPVATTMPLLAALLSLPPDEARFMRSPLTPPQQRQKTLEALVAFVSACAAQQPVLLVVEDLHWVDPSTLEWLTLLSERLETMPIFVLLTCRLTFQSPWQPSAFLTQMMLPRLPHHQVEQMVMHLVGGKPLPDEVLQTLVMKTDGIPLFVEELTKTVLQTDLLRETENQYELTAPFPDVAIPTTLHDSLMARLDRLGSAKSIVQLGATIGRQFPYVLLRAVLQWDDAVLQRELRRLVEAELLYPLSLSSPTIYVFKHALIQEVAYQSLVRSARHDYHQRIAQGLIEQCPETVAAQPELVAHHYTEGGQDALAITYWQRAGQRAIERSAYIEAISHLTKGLGLLQHLPASPERTQQELTLQLALGSPLLMTKGHTAPEVEHAYARAYTLCQQVGESPRLFPVLVGLWRFYFTRAELQTARRLGEQCLALAQRLQDAVFRHEAHLTVGSTLYILGAYVAAREHLEQGLALYDRQQSRSRGFSSGNDPGVVCLSRLAWALWMLGYPDQAMRRSHEALALARELGHPYSLGFALQYHAGLHQYRREARLVQTQAEATLALAQEQGFIYWLGGAKCMRGWALAEQGAVEEGIAELRQGFAIWLDMGANLGQTHLYLRLAEAYRHGGQLEAGLHVVHDALMAVSNTKERHYEPELYRFKGELLHQLLPFHPEAEDCFLHALKLARQRQAKSFELRAAMSLGQFWQQQGKQAEAQQILAAVYDWFTEGFETPDLQQAKALLETWSQDPIVR